MQINPVTSYYGSGYGPQNASGAGARGGLRALANEQLSSIATNGDGSISLADFKTALEGASGTSSLTDDQVSALFKKMDTNGDGSISPAEWGAFQQKVQGHHHHHRARGGADDSQGSSQAMQSAVSQLFASADKNGDGTLSQGELTSWLQNGPNPTSVNTTA